MKIVYVKNIIFKNIVSILNMRDELRIEAILMEFVFCCIRKI